MQMLIFKRLIKDCNYITIKLLSSTALIIKKFGHLTCTECTLPCNQILLAYLPRFARIRMELQFHPDPARKLSANLYDIHHCCVYSEKLLTTDRGTVQNM